MPASKFKNIAILVLAATTMAGGLLAWNQYLELIKLRAGGLDPSARADLQRRLLALEKRKNDLAAEVANLRAREAAQVESTAEDETAQATDGGRGNRAFRGRFGRRNILNNLSVLLDNPKFNKLWTQQQRNRVQLAYAGLFKTLNLNPEQADKLSNLLVERQESFMDVLAAARDQGNVSRSQIQTLLQQANSQIDSQIQSLLGPDGYSQYTNYLQTEPQRNQVNELQTRLAAAGVQPMQSYQSEQLVQILAQNGTQGGNAGGYRGGGGFFGGMGGLFGTNVTGPTITSGAVTQASTVLSQDQMQVLQQMQQQQQAQQQIRQALRQSATGGGRTVGAPTGSGAAASTAASHPSG